MSPITVGVLVAAILVLAGAVYLIARVRHPVEVTAVPDPADDRDGGFSQGRSTGASHEEGQSGSAPAPLPFVPPPLPQPIVEDPPVAAPPSPAASVRVTERDRVLRVGAHQLQLTREADERVFEILKMPEDKRVAIRQINENLGKKMRESSGGAPGSLPAEKPAGALPMRNAEAERARQTELEGLLGADAARVFNTNEHSAARILLRKLRPQWLRESQDQGPSPAGSPAPPP